MRTIYWNTADETDRLRVITRPAAATAADVTRGVAAIIADIAARSEEATNDWSQRLDGAPLTELRLTAEALEEARARTTVEDRKALAMAVANIRRFHEADRPADSQAIETSTGLINRRVWRPLDSVGLYVPGGTAPLFSTLLMLAIPARVAGVRDLVVVTPPSSEGPHPMMMLAAEACSLDRLWLVGGAQAIAALALGAGLPRVDKIFGPGNAWVAEAKRQVTELPGGPAVDLPAGPSELLVIADDTASPRVVAADLLAQAEHDADAQVILVTPSPALAEAVTAEVESQLSNLPRAEVARRSLASAAVVICRDLEQAAEVSNLYCPEHLSIQTAEPAAVTAQIRHAGAIFEGARAAETLGDYLSGPSHVLPTNGAARAFSGVTTGAFMKSLSVQTVRPEGMAAACTAAARLARLEGLEAHARAAEARVEVFGA